jgi:HlyD family secretion protein
MNRLRVLILPAVLALLIGGAVLPLLTRREALMAVQSSDEAGSQPVVQVALAEARPMERAVRLSGTLKSGSQATLSPKQGGRVTAVLVIAGQAVRRGQILLRLDNSDAQRQAEQAAAATRAARANWDKALEGERLKRAEVERRIADARGGVEQAKLQLQKAEAGIRLAARAAQADVQRSQAGVDAAKSALAQARRGARPEQRRPAELQVRQAERGVAAAKKNLDDVEFLYGKGGLPRVQLDQAREEHQKALDGLAQAQAQLDLLDAGALPEEIAAAEAQVRSAESALSAAQAAASRDEVNNADLGAARAQVRQAENGLQAALASRNELQVARSDIRAARAGYEQAQAASRLAAQQLSSAEIVSPVDGTATALTVNVGEMAGPGQPVVTVVGTAGVYLEAAAPSRLLAALQPGQNATVTVDTVRGQTFFGTVRAIGSVAGPDGRSFPVHIDVSAPAGVLKPGGRARAEVRAESHPGATTVPVEALRTEAGKTAVWVVRNRRVVAVAVETPLQDERRAMVYGDLRPGDEVIVTGAPGVSPGDEVSTRKAEHFN